MRSQNYIFDLPHLSRVHDPFSFLAGPLIYLYLKTLIERQTAFAKKNFLHFLPFAACVVYLIPYYVQNTADKLQNITGIYEAGLANVVMFARRSYRPFLVYYRDRLDAGEVLKQIS